MTTIRYEGQMGDRIAYHAATTDAYGQTTRVTFTGAANVGEAAQDRSILIKVGGPEWARIDSPERFGRTLTREFVHNFLDA